ncbi:hypothetical protein CCACVL1_03646, partial [Corchorus capsularis]
VFKETKKGVIPAAVPPGFVI